MPEAPVSKRTPRRRHQCDSWSTKFGQNSFSAALQRALLVVVPVTLLGCFHHRHLWRYFQALPNFRPPLCGGRLGPHLFPLREVPYAFLCYRHVLFWLGSQFATPGSQCGPQTPLRGPSWITIWASGAPQRPQRPLRGPSWVTKWALEAPLRPQSLCWVTIWALDAWVSFWAWEGGGTAVAHIFFLHNNVAAIASSKISFRKKWQSNGLFTPLHNTFSATKTATFQPN